MAPTGGFVYVGSCNSSGLVSFVYEIFDFLETRHDELGEIFDIGTGGRVFLNCKAALCRGVEQSGKRCHGNSSQGGER